MPSYVSPKKNAAFVFSIGLVSQADTKLLKASPAIAAGDFKVSIDGGAFVNLATLPVVTPASGKAVQVTLSAGEMNGDNIAVLASDAAGAEWCDRLVSIQTVTNQADDQAKEVTAEAARVAAVSVDVKLTTGRATKLDNLDAPITTRAIERRSTVL